MTTAEIPTTPSNYVTTATGLVRPVCEFCGRTSRAGQAPRDDGQPSFWGLPRGWSEAPYPPDYVHDDGSRGSLFTCPACNARMNAGEGMRSRQEPRR